MTMKKGYSKEWWKELYALRYENGWRESLAVTVAQTDFLEKVLNIRKETAVLDLGCGDGRHIIEFAKRKYENVVGMDYSFVLLKSGMAEAGRKKLSASFVCGDMLSPCFKCRFDAVYMMDISFGLLSDKENMKALNLISGLLKPQGHLLLDLFNLQYIPKLLKKDRYKIGEKTFIVENAFDVLQSIFTVNTTVIEGNNSYEYPKQKIKVYSYGDIEKMFREVNISIKAVYGDSVNPNLEENKFNTNSFNMTILGQKAF
ncbi:MAG: class I SAM-dependent methyltransferase [bacterium]|nr:class I SAM-dependent methyltransferase [bacterium]